MKLLTYILVFFFALPLYAQQAPQIVSIPEKEISILFDGQWLPGLDSLQIGMKNYKTLKNFRYGSENIGLEGVRGYTKISSTALSTYPKIRSAFQLTTDRTTKSYILTQSENSDETESRIYANTSSIPATGDYSTSIELDDSGNEYRTDTDGAELGRFASAPNGSVTYSNGVESLVWSGEEMSLTQFFTMEDADPEDAGAYPIDGTKAVNNTLATTGNTISIGTGSRDYFLVMTARPIQGVYLDLSVVNGTTSSLSAKYWKNDATWASVANPADGTDTGAALAQDGWFMFDFTSDAAPYHYQGNYYYAYAFTLSAGSATFKYISANAPMQPLLDLWDGIPRQPKQFQIWRNGDSKFKNWTEEVNIYSYESNPLIAQLDAMSTDDYILVMADDRLSAMRFEFLAGWVNEDTSVVNVAYWDGSAYTAVTGTEVDGTILSGATMGQNGLLWWVPPAESSETVKSQFGKTGYSYKITFTVALSGTYVDESDIMTSSDDIALDVVTVYPAQKTVSAFKFMTEYKGRTFGCGYIVGKQGGRCDYTQRNSTEIWNGADSSDDGVQSIYFSTSQDLIAAAEIYNRYGSQVITVLAAFTQGETHVLKGDSPEDFVTIRVSDNIGCPAPLTLASAEVGYEVAPDLKRNIMIWLSSVGPYGFDGQILFPIRGVDNYFDPDNSEAINFNKIEISKGWYDKSNKEYNLLIPSGPTQQTNNVWLVYDLIKKKWFSKSTGDAGFPQVGFPVQDVYGVEYIYSGINSGFLVRLENGTSWDGEHIDHIVETGDFWPTGNAWDLSRIRQVKFMGKRMAEDYVLTVNSYTNTDDVAGVGGIWQEWTGGGWSSTATGEWQTAVLGNVSFNIAGSSNRIIRDTIQTNLFVWTLRLRFLVTTDDTETVIKLMGWGIVYQEEDRLDD